MYHFPTLFSFPDLHTVVQQLVLVLHAVVKRVVSIFVMSIASEPNVMDILEQFAQDEQAVKPAGAFSVSPYRSPQALSYGKCVPILILH